LVEQAGVGRTKCFAPVAIAADAATPFARARITGHDGKRLIADVIP
jgi:hypothetical protein